MSCSLHAEAKYMIINRFRHSRCVNKIIEGSQKTAINLAFSQNLQRFYNYFKNLLAEQYYSHSLLKNKS